MIRVAVLDDHHAVRLGLESVVRATPDMVSVGSAATTRELAPLLYRTAVNVLVLDYRLADEDGLSVCRCLKQNSRPPAVVLYSAFNDAWLTVAALLAGVDALVSKSDPVRELLHAVRTVATGATSMPPILPAYLTAAAEALDHEDRPLLSLLGNGARREQAARILDIDVSTLSSRLDRMLRRCAGHRARRRVAAGAAAQARRSRSTPGDSRALRRRRSSACS